MAECGHSWQERIETNPEWPVAPGLHDPIPDPDDYLILTRTCIKCNKTIEYDWRGRRWFERNQDGKDMD